MSSSIILFDCLIPKTIIEILYRSHVIVKLILKYIWSKDFLTEINCIKPLLSNTVYGRRQTIYQLSCFGGKPTLKPIE